MAKIVKKSKSATTIGTSDGKSSPIGPIKPFFEILKEKKSTRIKSLGRVDAFLVNNPLPQKKLFQKSLFW